MRLTQRQLRRWQRAEAMGAMARAVVVMAAGIHEMYWARNIVIYLLLIYLYCYYFTIHQSHVFCIIF